MYLDLNQNVEFYVGNYKRFQKDEFHVTRVSREDILILMLDGRLYFTEDGKETEVGKGEYYLQRSGLLQSALRPSSDAYYIYCHFKGAWCEEGIHGLPQRGSFDIEKIYQTADSLCRAVRAKNQPRIIISRMFYQILEELLNENRRLDDGLLVAEKIHRYISANYTERLEISGLAEHFSYSSDYVIRVFKRAYGMTPHSYITACRIEYAKLLLSTTDRPIGEVAEICGYSDFTTFYRAFRARTDRSPKEWRLPIAQR